MYLAREPSEAYNPWHIKFIARQPVNHGFVMTPRLALPPIPHKVNANKKSKKYRPEDVQMKKLTLLSLLGLLMACGTADHVPEAVLYTQQVTPGDYFAGSPQIPETTYYYPKKVQEIAEANGAMLRLAARHIEDPDKAPSPDEALAALEPISLANLNDYETAFYHRIRGYAYQGKGDYRKAIEEFNLMLAKREFISVSAEAKATKTLAILHFELQEYQTSLENMFKLPELLESLSGDDFYQVSRLQEITVDYKNALTNINKAILITGDSSPQDTNLYYQLMAKIYEKMKSVPKPD